VTELRFLYEALSSVIQNALLSHAFTHHKTTKDCI